MNAKCLKTGLVGISLILFVSCNKQKVYSNADEIIAEMKTGLKTITVQSLKEKIENMETYFLLIDVREPNEHSFGFIPGSINIPAGTILFTMANDKFWEDQMMYAPEKKDEIVVYCKKGKRSVLAANFLRQLGFSNVRYIEGGWKNWEMNYPLLYEKSLDANTMHHEESDEGGC